MGIACENRTVKLYFPSHSAKKMESHHVVFMGPLRETYMALEQPRQDGYIAAYGQDFHFSLP